MNQLIVLTLTMPGPGGDDPIHPALLLDPDHRVLVDCGHLGALPQLEQALDGHGVPPESLTHLILTHQDHDHLGCAAALKRKYPQVQVLALEEEAPCIDGTKKSLRLAQAEALQATLPPEQQAFGEAFSGMLRSVEPVPVDGRLRDGQQLPFAGGCQVLSTPGHTPGHLSLYLPGWDTLIAGDAMALEAGEPVVANPQFALDLGRAQASLELLLRHPARRVLCYHGGGYQKGS